MTHHLRSRYRNPLPGCALGTALGLLAACGGSNRAPLTSGPSSQAYLYVATNEVGGEAVPGAVYQYVIDTAGAPAPLAVASVPTGVRPTGIVSDATGRYVYVINSGDDTISQYTIGADGGLVALSPAVVSLAASSPFLTLVGVWITMDPGGRFVYVVGSPQDPAGPSASIAQFSIRSDGTLAPLAPADVTIPFRPSGPLVIDAGGRYAYLPGQSTGPGGAVSQFAVNADGTLSALTPATVAAALGITAVAVAPDGSTAYGMSVCVDSNCDGQIAPYPIGADGTLGQAGAGTLTGSHVNPVGMVFDAAGAYLLANDMGVDTNNGLVYQYTVGGAGALQADTPASLPVTSGAVAIAADGSNLYALSANAVGAVSGQPAGGHIDQYLIGSGGLLMVQGTSTVAGSQPAAMTLVPAH
jgi:6-phosphogluconolactonase (cycloisomerase 2 family)